MARETIRSRIISIPQDPLINRDDSLRKNVDPAGANTDKVIVSALQKVKLWSILASPAADFGSFNNDSKDEISIATILDTLMSDRPLSTGQLQLLALARAILMRRTRPGKLVILDEATSNIDAATDLEMQRVIREEFDGCTIISIAHRLETIMDADEIVVLEDGEVVETGNPRLLREKRDGKFRDLWMNRG